jgi:hypothetical protein
VFPHQHHLSLQPRLQARIFNMRLFSMTEFVTQQISPFSMVEKIKIPSHLNSLFTIWKKPPVLLDWMAYQILT